MKNNKELQSQQRLLNKTLKKYGISSIKQKKKKKYIPEERIESSKTKYKSLNSISHHGVSLEDKEYKKTVSNQYVIGQAYNKSGFSVLTKAEQSDSDTGKRR